MIKINPQIPNAVHLVNSTFTYNTDHEYTLVEKIKIETAITVMDQISIVSYWFMINSFFKKSTGVSEYPIWKSFFPWKLFSFVKFVFKGKCINSQARHSEIKSDQILCLYIVNGLSLGTYAFGFVQNCILHGWKNATLTLAYNN